LDWFELDWWARCLSIARRNGNLLGGMFCLVPHSDTP
jgi:hypothetical protein